MFYYINKEDKGEFYKKSTLAPKTKHLGTPPALNKGKNYLIYSAYKLFQAIVESKEVFAQTFRKIGQKLRLLE